MTTVARADMVLDARTQGFVRDMNKAQATARSFARDAKKAEGASATMAGGLKRAANAAAILTGPFGGISSRLSFLSSGFASAGAAATGFAVAISAATAFLTFGSRALTETEQQLFKLEALLKSTGNASGFTAKQLDEMAREIGFATLASAEGIREAQGVLLTFKTVQGPIFEEAIRLSQDLAAVMGTDAKNSALQLGKALEDPATGLTALKRSGVSFTDSEREMIKAMQEAGDVADAQRLILKKLADQVGGAGAGEAGGLAGKIDTLSQSFRELAEAGAQASGINNLLGDLADKFSEAAQNITAGFSPEVRLNELLKERFAIEQRLHDLRTNGIGITDMFGELPADLEQRRFAINEEIRAIQAKREAEIRGQTAAQQAAQESAKQAAKEREATKEKEKQLELMEQQLKMMQKMNGGSGGSDLYKKLFGDGTPKGKLIDNTAFNNYATAAKRARDTGNDAEFKRLISRAADVFEQVSKSGSNGIFRYDQAGMRDVLTRLTGGQLQVNKEKHTIEFKIQDKSITMFGDTESSRTFVKAFKDALQGEASLVGVSG